MGLLQNFYRISYQYSILHVTVSLMIAERILYWQW